MPAALPWQLAALLAGALVIAAWWARRRQRLFLETVPVVEIPNVRAAALDNERTVHVFLPPGYDDTPYARYPTLYLNDGQDVAALGLRETLARLYKQRLLRPILVVAIPTNADRLREYGTAGVPNAQGLGDRAGAYTAFVVDELRPLILERFRSSPDPADNAWLGASLGGLSALDIAWSHPDRFGVVGVMSGSFWWRAGTDETAVPADRLIVPELIRQQSYRPGFRAWFEAGTRDETHDRDGDGIIDAIGDTLAVLTALEAVGYRRGAEVVYLEVVDGRHDYDTWRRVLPTFLRWAFGPALPQGAQSSD